MAKSIICTILITGKKFQTVLRKKIPLLCRLNTATFSHLIHYLTQMTTYTIPSLSKIPAAKPSSSRHYFQHLTPVYTCCIQFPPYSHTLKINAFYINIKETCIYIAHEEVMFSTSLTATYSTTYLT